MKCKYVRLNDGYALNCFCDIALKITKQVTAWKQLLKTWPTSVRRSASWSSFLHFTLLLAFATLRWKVSTRLSAFECCLTAVIQDPRVDPSSVINAWCIAAIDWFHCRLSFALTCFASCAIWRLWCHAFHNSEAASTEFASQLSTTIARYVVFFCSPHLFKVFARLLPFAPLACNHRQATLSLFKRAFSIHILRHITLLIHWGWRGCHQTISAFAWFGKSTYATFRTTWLRNAFWTGATLRWKFSLTAGLECCLTLVIQDPRIYFFSEMVQLRSLIDDFLLHSLPSQAG